ncbi:MAG TPA: hypothetical protein VFM97_00505 [Gammaproteobacteria bacterium]|nr:hypothetical protein [Gammaproteobacteria bacterium]
MKLLYYRIEGDDILALVKARAERYARLMALLKTVKKRFRIREVYGYHFHAFRALRIEGVIFEDGAPIPRGWYQRYGDPAGVHRPSKASKAGKRMTRLLNLFRLPEPVSIFRACGCEVIPTTDSGAFYPSIGIEGDTFIVAIPAPDDATHRLVDGLVPLTDAEVRKLTRKSKRAAKSRLRRWWRAARGLLKTDGATAS